jgi:hypothetical protein
MLAGYIFFSVKCAYSESRNLPFECYGWCQIVARMYAGRTKREHHKAVNRKKQEIMARQEFNGISDFEPIGDISHLRFLSGHEVAQIRKNNPAGKQTNHDHA